MSMVKRMSELLAKKDILILTGILGSGKSTLAQQISEEACRLYPNGANFRFIKDLGELKQMMTDKETFLNLDTCIKSWFNETCLKVVFQSISEVLQNNKNKVHIIMCAPPEIWNKFNKLLLSSDFLYDVLDLTDNMSYTDSDLDVIFQWHMLRNLERKKYEKQDREVVMKWIEEYRKHQAKEIGKPALAYLLCRNLQTLENPTFLFQEPRIFLESEISGLLNKQNSFVVLVYLMLHNGKAISDKMEVKVIKDICSAYKFPLIHTKSVNEANYDEIEIRKNDISISSDVVLCATFDFVWKDHKDLILRHCDDDLFLERITLTNCTEEEIAEIVKRFKSMIKAGKPNVEHHYLLDDSSLKELVQR